MQSKAFEKSVVNILAALLGLSRAQEQKSYFPENIVYMWWYLAEIAMQNMYYAKTSW